jgi:hypothetical protein
MWRENLFLDAFDVLDSLREHLECDAASDSESGLSPHMEPTQVQVLSRLAAELVKLYDCCKENEFQEDSSLCNIDSFEHLVSSSPSTPGEDDAMVSRFVRVVITVAKRSSSGPESRFLSQAQRSCMDLLRTMASNGSPEAFLNLTLTAGTTFFAERESDGKARKGVDILCHEASNVILEEFPKEAVSDECKVLVLARLLSIFLENQDVMTQNKKKGACTIGISYTTLIPIMRAGLESGKKLDHGPKETSKAILGLLDNLWEKIFLSLSRMLSPIPNVSERIDISHLTDLVELVNASSANVPSRHSLDLCTILSSGASRCLEIAKAIEISGENTEDTINLFAACFKGACRSDARMQSIAKDVLEQAFQTISSNASLEDLNVTASLKICQVLQDLSGIEDVVIAVFRELSQLVGVEFTSLRRAAGTVLATTNISGVLEDALARRQHAEERALISERRVSELEEEVETLQRQKEALERQLGLL